MWVLGRVEYDSSKWKSVQDERKAQFQHQTAGQLQQQPQPKRAEVEGSRLHSWGEWRLWHVQSCCLHTPVNTQLIFHQYLYTKTILSHPNPQCLFKTACFGCNDYPAKFETAMKSRPWMWRFMGNTSTKINVRRYSVQRSVNLPTLHLGAYSASFPDSRPSSRPQGCQLTIPCPVGRPIITLIYIRAGEMLAMFCPSMLLQTHTGRFLNPFSFNLLSLWQRHDQCSVI